MSKHILAAILAAFTLGNPAFADQYPPGWPQTPPDAAGPGAALPMPPGAVFQPGAAGVTACNSGPPFLSDPNWESPPAIVAPPAGPPFAPAQAGAAVPSPIGPGLPSPAAAYPSALPAPACPPAEKPWQSAWYTRLDYFHWHESDGPVDEWGPLFTLGYQTRVGRGRFRFEGFGGDVHYSGADMITLQPLSGTTRYLGGRGEMELLFEPAAWPRATFFLGVGTRFWARDLLDSYEERWLTIYPYVGLELRHELGERGELFTLARVGATAVTMNDGAPPLMSTYEPLWPGGGVTAQVQFGLRAAHLEISAFYELMTWGESPAGWAYDWTQNNWTTLYQPRSQMYTIGGQLALTY